MRLLRSSRTLLLVPFASVLAVCGGDALPSAGSDEPVPSPEPSDPGQATSGQIVVDENDPAWLRYRDGGSFFLCGPGDPEGFLYRGERQPDGTRDGDQLALIEKLGPTGANSIYLMAVRSHGGDGGRTENPFRDNDPSRGVEPAVLDQWETWFDAMEERDILVFFLFYDDGARVWDTGDEVGSEERSFLETIVDRFEHHPNLIWVVGEEYNEAYSKRRAEDIAAVIRSADDHDHVIAVHQTPGLTFDFAESPAVDQFAVQTTMAGGLDAFHARAVQAVERANGAYNVNIAEVQPNHGRGPADVTRRVNWAAATAGAYVMVLRWDVAGTPVAELEGCGAMVELMEGMELSGMRSHDELASGTTRWVLAAPGERYLLYATDATAPMGVRELPGGTYDLTWLDTVTGRTVERSAVSVAGGSTDWAVPEDLGSEVALRIVRR